MTCNERLIPRDINDFNQGLTFIFNKYLAKCQQNQNNFEEDEDMQMVDEDDNYVNMQD